MWTLMSFSLFLGGFALIGVLSVRAKKSTPKDYLVANREIGPWMTALSSMATNNSGYAFVGLVGFAYRFGLHSIWLSIAWIMGDVLVWLFVHRRVHQLAEAKDAWSVPGLLSTNTPGNEGPARMVSGGVILVFLSVYAAAQLKAGGSALFGLFNWPMEAGVLIGSVLVVLYCFSGGIRASIWTDTAQSVVMMAGMVAVLVLGIANVGGPAELSAALAGYDPKLAAWFPPHAELGFPLYFLGFVAGGFGAIGAPHILIRSMALNSQENFNQARRVYFATFVPFVAASAIIGLYARILVPELALAPTGTDPAQVGSVLVQQAESALPVLAKALLPDFLVGMMLAAIFAAIMSTADSQILSCSASLTQDIVPKWRNHYMAGKFATLIVAVFATVTALFAGEGVFVLVLVAWSALAVTLGPILLVRIWGGQLSSKRAYAMMIAGFATVLIWDRTPWADDIYNLLPGLTAAGLMYFLVGKMEGSAPKPRT